MSKLEELLERFRNDRSNTKYADGSRRFDKEIAWIDQMIRNYAEVLNMPIDEVVERMESGRQYWWPNYYQPCNFPELSSKSILGIFKTYDEFRDYAKEHWDGFVCPKCGAISQHPQECVHRINKDNVCDWCAYGLLDISNLGVIVLESGLKKIPIFKPVPKSNEF